jgi:acyl-CoA synthetase (AMP-forming)/AMP-acid ligase II
VQAWGLTETTGTAVILSAADHDPDGPNRHRLRAVGVAVEGSEVRVVDADGGEDVAQGQVGEIWIRSPTVVKGYWSMPEATEETILPGGWLHLAVLKCPTSVEWLETLPRNPSGKVLKKDLRAPFWAGRDRMVG